MGSACMVALESNDKTFFMHLKLRILAFGNSHDARSCSLSEMIECMR
jgi:hypothetical protein